jgi:hypothetical protein
MGGVDNLVGVDFQITYCVHRVLSLFRDHQQFSHLQFEGLDEEGQDFTLQRSREMAELVQIKKRGEGYLWTPSSLKPILEKFIRRYDTKNVYVFFSDGSLNPELIQLREKLARSEYSSIDDQLLSSLQPAGIPRDSFLQFLAQFRLLTRQFASSDPTDPALVLRKECKLILASLPSHL